jgi:hypothetical protein
MKDSDVSIGVYKSKPATDFSPHIKRALVFILFTLVTRIIVRLAVMNLSRFMFEVSGSSELAEIFQQLKTADIRPSWIIPLLFSAIASILTVQNYSKSKNKKRVIVVIVLLLVILFAVTIAASVYFTTVNEIQVRHIVKILLPLMKSGALQEVL